MANDPDVLIADEPTTALDVTVQAQVLDVIRRVHERTGSAIVLVTHDLGVVAGIADRVAVMYAGRLVETADAVTIFHRSAHPYTRALLRSLPRLDEPSPGPLSGIDGNQPSPADLPPGCAFHPRCPLAVAPGICDREVPALAPVGAAGHESACHRAEDAARPAEVTGPRAGGAPAVARAGEPVLTVRDLVKHFPPRRGRGRGAAGVVHAVCGVSFEVAAGETLALVGESGSGKTTTARMVLNLLPATAGAVSLRGQDVLASGGRDLRALRRHMQIVFQDPYASLNPRRSIGATIAAPMRVHGASGSESRARAEELLSLTGLDPADFHRYPHELSGGQRQRVGIARALALEPELLVLDEPVSALDVSVRAGVVNLLEALQDRLALAYVLIAHDLSIVRHAADRVAVMFLGKIVETGDRDAVFRRPSHPYTQALLSAVPVPDPLVERGRRRILLTGEQPDPTSPPSGCRFRTRCWKAQDVCADEEPALVERGQGHPVACHFAEPSRFGSTS
jgi:peptide/nickel transport system ATP-binding protein